MDELLVETRARVAWLTLDRPARRNALSPDLLGALVDACESLREAEQVRVVVLRGAGGVFSAGADLVGFMSLLGSPDAEAGADLGRRAADALASLPQITVAAIEGHCVGGGVVLAAACDLRWAARDAWLSIPEMDLGIPLAWGALPRLVQLLGETAALELVLSGRRIEAEEAAALGLLGTLVEGDFEEWLDAHVAALAARPRGALRTTKAQLQAIRAGTFDPSTDAAALLAALHDPESQRAAQEYFARRRRPEP